MKTFVLTILLFLYPLVVSAEVTGTSRGDIVVASGTLYISPIVLESIEQVTSDTYKIEFSNWPGESPETKAVISCVKVAEPLRSRLFPKSKSNAISETVTLKLKEKCGYCEGTGGFDEETWTPDSASSRTTDEGLVVFSTFNIHKLRRLCRECSGSGYVWRTVEAVIERRKDQ